MKAANQTKEEQSAFINTFSNPFQSGKVDGITIFITRELFTEGIKYWAQIKFKNGNSAGTQKIEAEDFCSLVQRIEQFIKSL